MIRFFGLGAIALLSPLFSQAASLYLAAPQTPLSVGDSFVIEVRADTQGESVSAAEAEIAFDPGMFLIRSVDTSSSVFSSWPTQPFFSNENGRLVFAGWMDTARAGEDILLLKFEVEARSNGSGDVRIESGAIIAADGRGSNIVSSLGVGVVTIAPQGKTDIRPSSTPEPEATIESEQSLASTSVVSPPLFEDVPRELTPGDRLVIKGFAPPGARLVFFVQEGEEAPAETVLMSAADGSFTFAPNERMREGVYRVWAIAEGKGGDKSGESERHSITVRSLGFAAAAAVSAEMLSAIFPFVAALLVIGLSIGYLFHRRSRTEEGQ